MNYVLPPHHQVITFSRQRWLEIYYSLLEQRGPTTEGIKNTLWDVLRLSSTLTNDTEITLVFLDYLADTIRWWEGTRMQETQ